MTSNSKYGIAKVILSDVNEASIWLLKHPEVRMPYSLADCGDHMKLIHKTDKKVKGFIMKAKRFIDFKMAMMWLARHPEIKVFTITDMKTHQLLRYNNPTDVWAKTLYL